jgi:predicted transcriptional regulator of viral defense system
MRADVLIAECSARQHGLVTRTQLQGAGQHTGVLYRRLGSGLLRRVQRGVYQVGPVAAPLAWAMAAVLACSGGRGVARSGATVSHHSAAALWQLTPGLLPTGPVWAAALATSASMMRSGAELRACLDLRRQGLPAATLPS